MSPKTGRPKAENPKNIEVKVRFDKELHQKLMTYCNKKGITRTDAIRNGIKLLLEKQ